MSEIIGKIIFELTPDEDDYPPVSAESVWGIYQGDNVYILDNTPYYTYGVSKGDSVLVRQNDGELVVTHVIKQGGHSTIRVYANDPEKNQKLSRILKILVRPACLISCRFFQLIFQFLVFFYGLMSIFRQSLMERILHMKTHAYNTRVYHQFVLKSACRSPRFRS